MIISSFQARFASALLLIFILHLSISSSAPQLKKYPPKKYFKKAFQNEAFLYQDLKELAKRLEYYAHSKQKAREALEFGLSPLNLNLLPDEEIAKDVEEGVEEEFQLIDDEFANTSLPLEEEKEDANPRDVATLMHQGIYTPDPDYNSLIDGLVLNVKKDINNRSMDPLYFGIHNRGIIKHSNKRRNFHPSNLTESTATTTTVPPDEPDKERKLLGVGILRGLSSLSRVGHVETRDEGNHTLVRSHYFFGPLNIEIIFASRSGRLRSFNPRLNAVAAHALLKISKPDNSTKLQEFIIDSPMEYEIRLDGVKNQRIKSLSQASLTRLFKRSSRMETRLKRSFKRGLRKPIKDPAASENDGNQDNGSQDAINPRNSSRKRKQKGRETSNKRQKDREINP